MAALPVATPNTIELDNPTNPKNSVIGTNENNTNEIKNAYINNNIP
jgi:hypothetical protein